MRDKLIALWRVIQRKKFLYPLIVLIRWFAATDFFNTILDFTEVNIFHTSYVDSKQFFENNRVRVRDVLKKLDDEKSCKVYENIWRYRISHHRCYLKGIVDKDQYYDKDLIKLGTSEGYVDCGAFRGDTIVKFINHLPQKNKYDFIIAFEPDEYNFKVLKNKICKSKLIKRRESVKCYPLGTWSEKAVLRFKSNTEEACMISDDGDSIIKVKSIDEVVGGGKVTYIKMDVEGAELNSLIGAKNIICRDHPRLAISIYHSDADMLDIIEYVRSNYPFYKLYVRHYTYYYADTVLYAIDWTRDY